MIIYGVAILAFSYIVGQLFGEVLGNLLGINANVGGVGFSMILLMILTDWLRKSELFNLNTQNGIQFWNQMYIPIIVAMSATQNVKLALSSGLITLLVGIIPVIICFLAIPFLSKFIHESEIELPNTTK
jgi:malonate transporter MadL subunit